MSMASPLMLRLLMWLGVALTGLAAWTVRTTYRRDAIILAAAGAILAGHILFWQSGFIANNRLGASIALLFEPMKIYLAGLILGACFFATKMRGWQRGIYLAAGLVCLSPLFLLFVVIPIAFLSHS